MYSSDGSFFKPSKTLAVRVFIRYETLELRSRVLYLILKSLAARVLNSTY